MAGLRLQPNGTISPTPLPSVKHPHPLVQKTAEKTFLHFKEIYLSMKGIENRRKHNRLGLEVREQVAAAREPDTGAP